MVKANRPKVLVVDDEERITRALCVVLRKDFDVTAVSSGCLGLAAMDSDGPFDVIVSDMQMPEMNGARFLAKARTCDPDAKRVLLTGQANFEAAAAAVNEGGVFQFLTKPCTPSTLRDVLHRASELRSVERAERDLAEESLEGTVQVLADLLARLHPQVARRSMRVTEAVVALADGLGLRDRGPFQTAAMLANLGTVTYAPLSIERYLSGSQLPGEGLEERLELPQITADLLGPVPQLKCAADMIRRQLDAPFERDPATPLSALPRVDQGAELLRTATEFVERLDGGVDSEVAAEELRASGRFFDELLDGLACTSFRREVGEPMDITAAQLTVGVELMGDVASTNGIILASAGSPVTETLILLTRRYAKRGEIVEPIRVAYPIGDDGPDALG